MEPRLRNTILLTLAVVATVATVVTVVAVVAVLVGPSPEKRLQPQTDLAMRVPRSYTARTLTPDFSFEPREPAAPASVAAGAPATEPDREEVATVRREPAGWARVGRLPDPDIELPEPLAPPPIPEAEPTPKPTEPEGLALDLPGADRSERLEEQAAKTEVEQQRDAPDDSIEGSSARVYGSLRVRATYEAGRKPDYTSSPTRVGGRGRIGIWPSMAVFGRAETRWNMDLDENPTFERRLLYLGVESHFGSLSFGKQWSAYYDVAVWTDQLPFFGGVANGTFNSGDGSLSGTGRAGRLLQFRRAFGDIKVSAQAQVRDLTENSKSFADTWGVSLRYHNYRDLDVGLAYNEVRDGVVAPFDDEPGLGDKALIVGARYKRDKVFLATTFARTEAHEKDDLDRLFDGKGLEVYGDYDLTSLVRLRGAYHYLTPDPEHPGLYQLERIVVGCTVGKGEPWQLHVLYAHDAGRNSDGSPDDRDRLGIQVHWNF